MISLVDLSGRTVLVTGASSGIGRQIAITCSELGAKVILVARNEERLREVIGLMNGNEHAYYTADLSVTDEIETIVKRIVSENGPLDGMAYAAGVSADVPLQMSKPKRVEDVFRINYYGFYELCRVITKKGNFRPGMRIVGISSTAAMKGVKSSSIYCATKAAMNSAVQTLAKELSDKDICVNAVMPGMTNTEMYKKTIEKYGNSRMEELSTRQYRGIIEPTGVASAVAFLLSPAAEYITGVALPVDGGLLSS